jgi:oligoribonuclease NrnB/cAMP/cGMP phosphodiesterase (DHH superfamily)
MMLTKESKIKLFTHNDLDGIGCEIVGRLAFENIDVTIVKNPKDASEKVYEFLKSYGLDNYDKVFITDISVSENMADMITEMTWDKVVLLDHHATAEYLNKHDWATVRPSRGKVGESPKESGTNMFFEYLVMQHGFFVNETYRDALTVFVEKVRRYDTWEWKEVYNDLEALNLNTLYWLLGREKFVQRFVNRFQTLDLFIVREGSWTQMFDDIDQVILEMDNDRKESYIDKKEKQMIVKTLLGHKIGLVFSEQYTSELGNILSERHPDLKFIVMVDMGSRKISYRTVHDDINLGKDVAKVFGGGGHPKASGSEFSDSVLDLAFNLIFGIGFTGKLKKFIDKLSKK